MRERALSSAEGADASSKGSVLAAELHVGETDGVFEANWRTPNADLAGKGEGS